MSQHNSPPFPSLEEDIHQALRQWHSHTAGNTVDSSPLHYLFLFRKIQSDQFNNPQKATKHLLHGALDALAKIHSADAQLLRDRFLDREKVHTVANRLNVADSTVYSLQRDALTNLANLIREMEIEARGDQAAKLGERIGAATYSHLVGVQKHLDHLIALLRSQEAPYLISIEGLGGIGKTSLADALMRRVIDESVFDDIGWVTARQSHLNLNGGIDPVAGPALTAEALVEALAKQLLPDLMGTAAFSLERTLAILEAHLKSRPHLVVVDNLETVEDVRDLLPTLQRLANPTKFLLTSRESLYTEPNVYHFNVPELESTHALQLIRQEAKLSNLPVLAESPDEILLPIVETVGGNPLAIRLVVGQLHIHSIDVVLADLAEARGESVENLYTFIYRRAWDNLDELSREVLIAMPLVSEKNEDINFLSQVANLSEGDLRTGLNKLVTLNLVNVHGELNDRRYGIHGLTRTFLYRQVVLWEELVS